MKKEINGSETSLRRLEAMGGGIEVQVLHPISSETPRSLSSSENGGSCKDMRFLETSFNFDSEIVVRRRDSLYQKLMLKYQQLQHRVASLETEKEKILRYKPGDWLIESHGMSKYDYEIPEVTTLLLIGNKGSGKSTLVNNILNLFEDDRVTSHRAQVFYGSCGQGTKYFREYMVPNSSFCVYDSQGLSGLSSEDCTCLQRWMTEGIQHGELGVRKLDELPNWGFRKKPEGQEAQYKCHSRNEKRMVNFVIFVVDALLVLKSMGSGGSFGMCCSNNLSQAFNSPFLAFKGIRHRLMTLWAIESINRADW
ncbi:hypothetical protein AMTR_s00007p00242150 [Amborella trichopoda]|uniref:G domain-containing protein n=1 Tax=Amborella trichopoda TaxID=13333 RepID=W1PEG1_AMBTC|nr:hypothetical protein AMTR_s00007p00242150 [Amborella trichopoda]